MNDKKISSDMARLGNLIMNTKGSKKDQESWRRVKEHFLSIEKDLNIALSAFHKILDSDVQPYDFIYKTLEDIGKIQ